MRAESLMGEVADGGDDEICMVWGPPMRQAGYAKPNDLEEQDPGRFVGRERDVLRCCQLDR